MPGRGAGDLPNAESFTTILAVSDLCESTLLLVREQEYRVGCHAGG